MTGVTDDTGRLLKSTDGDLRRSWNRVRIILQTTAGSLMRRGPKRIRRQELAAAALQLMEHHAITSLFVFDNDTDAVPCGVLHLHDLLKAGIA